MTVRDVNRFTAGLVALADLLDVTLAETRIEGYFKALADLPIETVEAALDVCARSCKFFPKPAEIREAVLGTPADHAALAWDRVLTAIGVHGFRSSVDFRDPVVHAVIDSMGGWHVLAAEMPSNPREQSYRAADFAKLFRAFSVKLPGPVRAYLPGLCEIENRDNVGRWDHAIDYRDPVLVLATDGRHVLARRPSLPGGPPRIPVEMGTLLRLPPSQESEHSA